MKPIETTDSCELAESSLRAKAKSNLQMIGQDSHGNWVVRDLAGQRGGLFVNRGEALRFAMRDDNGGPRAVVMVPGVLEFGIDGLFSAKDPKGSCGIDNGAMAEIFTGTLFAANPSGGGLMAAAQS